MGSNNSLDLSQDDNQHIKPQYSYAQMITQAILNAPEGKLNLNGIYKFIMNKYSYYRHQQAAGWQVSFAPRLFPWFGFFQALIAFLLETPYPDLSLELHPT
jgi:hypothetical protein